MARALVPLLIILGAGMGGCSEDRHQIGIGPTTDGGMTDQALPGHPLMISSGEAVRRLAALLWNTSPDAALTAAAGNIRTREDVGVLAQQMLRDPRARVGVGAFYRWWLELAKVPMVAKDPTLFPEWTAQASADAARETETFAVNVTLDLDGGFPTLMTGAFSYLNERLAGLYGVSGIVGDTLQRVNLDPALRAGLLTQPSLLALNSPQDRTSITVRGQFVRTHFYCDQARPPGPSDTMSGTTPPPNPTGRQRLEASLGDVACHQCHDLLDPPGFAYEGFDTIGRARTMDNGSPVDLTGKVSNGAGADLAFNGPVQLAAILSDLEAVHRCMARQWLSYAVGRTLLPAEDAVVDGLRATFKSAGLDLRALIAAVTQSDVFLAP